MIEINGTYYAKDCIKSIGMVVEKMKPNGQWIYQFEITLHVVNRGIIEGVIKANKEQAEQSRKQLIEQLNK